MAAHDARWDKACVHCNGGPQAAPWIDLEINACDADVRATLLDLRADMKGVALPEALLHAAQIVLAEICNNIVEHAYAARGAGEIRIRIWGPEAPLLFCIQDRGAAMPGGLIPRPNPPQADPTRPESWPEGGFGWSLVHTLTQRLEYWREDDVNTLCFSMAADEADLT